MIIRTVAVFSGALVLVLGVTMLVMSGQSPTSSGPISMNTIEPAHLVTNKMVSEAESWTRRVSPTFKVLDADGTPIIVGNSQATRPQFVYFVVDGCPCSMNAEPFFENMWLHFDKGIDFMAVTDGDAKQAKIWAKQMVMAYPIIPDPKLKIVRAFGATNSVVSALIDTDGRIVKMWPGYSRSILQDMNKQMAALLGQPVRTFDIAYAPVKQAAGCTFKL